MIILGLILTTFELTSIFDTSWGSIENWLEFKIEHHQEILLAQICEALCCIDKRNHQMILLNILSLISKTHLYMYRAFHVFWQAKFDYGGLLLGMSQFTLLPRLPLKMMLNL